MAKDKHVSVYFDRDTLQFTGLTDAIKKQLEESYKGIDLQAELSKMGLWLMSSKGNRRTGNIGFIMNWLNNASPKPPSVNEQLDLMQADNPLRPLLNEYLEGLWKNREHILAFNTIKKKS